MYSAIDRIRLLSKHQINIKWIINSVCNQHSIKFWLLICSNYFSVNSTLSSYRSKHVYISSFCNRPNVKENMTKHKKISIIFQLFLFRWIFFVFNETFRLSPNAKKHGICRQLYKEIFSNCFQFFSGIQCVHINNLVLTISI